MEGIIDWLSSFLSRAGRLGVGGDLSCPFSPLWISLDVSFQALFFPINTRPIRSQEYQGSTRTGLSSGMDPSSNLIDQNGAGVRIPIVSPDRSGAGSSQKQHHLCSGSLAPWFGYDPRQGCPEGNSNRFGVWGDGSLCPVLHFR